MTTLADPLEHAAATMPGRLALAGAPDDLGLARGDRVALATVHRHEERDLESTRVRSCGCLRIRILVDRSKDMIVTGGENVYGIEVEEVLYAHPTVLEAAVFAVPGERWGEAAHAIVVPREQVTAEELLAFCRERMAGYELPQRITFSEDPLPTSGPGKILKRALREPYWVGRDTRIGN